MHIILIPGLWLDGSTWERVVPLLEQAGHRPHPITLPGLESNDTDRSTIGLPDHVDAVVRVIDSLDPAEGKVAVVGHSGGSGIGHAAVDARPDRVARAIYIGGFPTGDGDPVVDGFPATGGDLPLPDWSDFDDADVADLDDQARAEFRERAIPSPAGLVRDRQRLSDERRYGVPVTVICPEFTSEMLRGWIEKGMGPVRELARIREVELVDLPSGHWPQFTRPEELARMILQRLPNLTGPTGGRVTAAQFHAAEGVEDWRVLAHGACAHFRTGSYAAGVALVDAIGELAGAADHYPTVDLRDEGVTVQLRRTPVRALIDLDLALARQISVAARELGLTADPSAMQQVDFTIDALVAPDVMPFWRAVLGYQQVGDEDLIDPHWRWPSIWFQPMDAPRPQRNRIHVDVWVPHDQAEARVAAALAAGGRLVRDAAPTWWTLADPEGNEVDVATVLGRD